MLDEAIIGTPNGIFFVDAVSGNISNHQLNEVVGGGPRCIVPLVDNVICSPQVSKGLIHYWRMDSSSGNPVYKCSSPEIFTCMVFSSCGGLMFAGTPSGTIYVWQTWTGNMIRSWTAHFGAVTTIVLSRDDSILFTAGEDANIKQYYLPDVFDDSKASVVPNPRIVFSAHSGKVNDVKLSDDEKILISCSHDNLMKFFNVHESSTSFNTQIFSISMESSSCEPLRIVTGVNTVYVGCLDGSIFSFSASLNNNSHQSWEMQKFSANHKSGITGMGITVDGSCLVTCAESDGVKIWDTISRVLLQSVIGPQQQLKNASCMLIVPKPPSTILPPSSERYNEPYRMVPAINAYLQFKPLQRTLTPIDSLATNIPLLKVPLFGSETKVKQNHAFKIDEKSNQLVLNGTSHVGVISSLEKKLEEQKNLTKSLSIALSDLYGRVQAMHRDGDERIELFFPNLATDELQSGSSKQVSKKRSRK